MLFQPCGGSKPGGSPTDDKNIMNVHGSNYFCRSKCLLRYDRKATLRFSDVCRASDTLMARSAGHLGTRTHATPTRHEINANQCTYLCKYVEKQALTRAKRHTLRKGGLVLKGVWADIFTNLVKSARAKF